MHFLSQTVSPFPLLFSTYKRNLSLLYCRIIVALCSLAVHPIIMTVCTDRPHLLTSILQPLLCVLVKLPSQDLSVSPHLSSNLILSDFLQYLILSTTLLWTFMSSVILICPLLTPVLTLSS